MSYSSVTSKKIPMIKAFRDLTRILGKCGVKSLVHENWMWKEHQRWLAGQLQHADYYHNRVPNRLAYGLGLKECKDWVEGYLDRKARTTST